VNALSLNLSGNVELRELGKTGVHIPTIGIGTWRYSGGVEPLLAGLALGACFIDTAESYGNEDVVAKAIRGKRNEVFLATKVSPGHFRCADVIRAAEHSLKRLRTDRIDLYQLHWPNHTVPIAETMRAMEDLADSGKIRFIGVSNFVGRDLENAQKALGKHKIVANQVRYNLIDRTIESGLLQYCRQQGITVIAHSPLSNTLQAIRDQDPENVLERIAEAKSSSVAQIAINWCAREPDIVVIPKSNSPEHVQENCRSLAFQLSPQEIETLNTKVRFRRRGMLESEARRLARYASQLFGKDL
jgi:diketogulonate reductase-like aldo/keto reductase